ncbi:dynamin family protein [Bacillus paranthracis]
MICFFGEEIQVLHNRINSITSSIVAVGQFSVGKSELLNALLGEKLLASRRMESTKSDDWDS